MIKNIIIPPFFKRNLYLLVAAAWLLTLSFIINNYWSSNSNVSTVQRIMSRYVQGAEEDFLRLNKDTAFTIQILRSASKESKLAEIISKNYFVFLYEKDTSNAWRLQFWNTQIILPDPGILNSPLKSGFTELSNGFYVWNKISNADKISIALIPIKWNFIVSNDYLQNDFVIGPKIGVQYDIFPGSAEEGTIKSLHGTSLFYLLRKNNELTRQDNIFSIWLRVAAVVFIFLFLHLCATYLAMRRRTLYGVAFLFGTLVFLRLLSYFLPIPFNFLQLELFNPSVYGSSFILRSLGDLLVNSILFMWVIIFARMQVRRNDYQLRNHTHPAYRWFILTAGILILITATFISVHIVRSLITDSQISFDVINFFSLNIYSLTGFIVLCCVAIGYYVLCQLVIHLIKPFFPPVFKELYLGIAICGLFILSFRVGHLTDTLELFSLGWLLLFVFLLNSSYLNLITSKVMSSKLVFWIFFFSVSITVVIIVENDKKEIRNRYHYAEVMASKTDIASESLLSAMLADFRLDFLTDNFSRLKIASSNKLIKDSLINNNFSGYTNRFDTKIYSYDAQENSLFNEDNAGYNQLNTILNAQSRPTGIAGMYYYDESYDRFSYISKKEIQDSSGDILGSVFILVTPRKVKNEKLYPELFSKGSSNAIENSSLYAFAIYNKGKLVSSHNDYPFSTTLPMYNFGIQQYLLAEKNGYDEMWYNAGNEKYIVIVKEKRQLIESITLFSYLFCAFLLLTSAFWLLTVFMASRMNPNKIREYWQLSIRNQIHGIIIFISVLSFIVIGAATILFFINRYQSNNQEKLSRAIQILKSQVSSSITDGWQLNDSMFLNDRPSAIEIEKEVLKIAEIHGVDVNIYALNGGLKLASLPYPYVKGIVSKKMDPTAFYHMSVLKEVQYFHKEHIGNLNFVSSYVPVFDAEGNASAYLNVPYFTSESKLQQEIANFLVTIINLNAFIFLIAGIVALFITNRITRSFSLIGEKMRDINLGKVNQAIDWKRNDEIGSLVKEYNTMLSKLDESAIALAKTEREGAWREMAKQVAHEIKNPLTPMKLSMQFLQRSIETNAPNIKELTAKVATTLVEQIDHLSNIASEFSQFANIENARMVILDINESLLSVKELYDNNEEINIIWTLMPEPILVRADKTHLNRLLTNLLLNAMQSVTGKIPVIAVSEKADSAMVLIEIKDNGSGIPAGIQGQIFTPNFTTKTSGTGLGLAMCKRIVEQMAGEIWFETSVENGTRFFIKIPRVIN